MTNIAASKTIVASSVFLDLVGFSKVPTSVQVVAKNRFNEILRLSLAELGVSNYWVRDLGDGALIICQNSPEHALFVALNVNQAYSERTDETENPKLELRIGLHLGVLKSNPDLEGRANYLGDGINATQRVMDFAKPGQILASRAFVDSMSYLHADFALMFQSPESRPDKHGRLHEVHVVAPSLETLARLRDEIAVGELHWQKARVAHPEIAQVPPLPAESLIEQAVTLIRNWFIPFNTLLVTGGILWGGFKWFGVSGWHAQLSGIGLVVIGVGLWLASSKGRVKGREDVAFGAATRTVPAVGLLVGAIGLVVIATSVVTSNAVGTAASSTTPIQSVQTVKEISPREPINDLPVKPTVLAAIQAPTPVVKVERKPPLTIEKTAQSNSIVTAVVQTSSSEADKRRCTALLNRTALGESISNIEKQELMQVCR